MKLEKLFDLCLIKWGIDSQILMCAEESSELALECLHFLRKKKHDINSLAEELADTQLMIEEMVYYFELTKQVQKIREKKIERLIEYLEEV